MQFGCFVQMFGIKSRQEGLVHISQVSDKASYYLKMNKVLSSVMACTPPPPPPPRPPSSSSLGGSGERVRLKF